MNTQRLLPGLAVVLLAACQPAGDPVVSNEDLVARYYAEVFNSRNLNFLEIAMHPDVIGHGPGIDDEVQGLENVAEFSAYIYEVYEDYTLTINELFGSRNLVQVRATVEALHRPTGRPVRFFGLAVYRLEQGKIVEYWRAYDRFDLYDNQLGGWRPGSYPGR